MKQIIDFSYTDISEENEKHPCQFVSFGEKKFCAVFVIFIDFMISGY